MNRWGRGVPLGRKCGRYGCRNFRNLVVSRRRFIFAAAKILDHAILGWTYLFRSTVRRGARLHARACPLVQRLYLTDVSRPLPHSPRVAAASSFQFIHFCFTAVAVCLRSGVDCAAPGGLKKSVNHVPHTVVSVVGNRCRVSAAPPSRRPALGLWHPCSRRRPAFRLRSLDRREPRTHRVALALRLQAVVFALLGVAGSLCAVRVARRLLTRKGGAR